MSVPANGNMLLVAGEDGGYQISRSVRLRSSASAYLNRTFGTPTNNNKWTYSGWFKRGTLGANVALFGNWETTQGANQVYFNTSDQLVFFQNNSSGTNVLNYVTTQVFRDPAAWYHIVISYDNTLATTALNIYVNSSSQITAFGTSSNTATQNGNYSWNKSGLAHYLAVGKNTANANFGYADGYFAEVNFIDGQALTSASFGAFNAVTGVWNPKAYSGTYGNNGFYLNFSDNSAATATTIGKDYSGNGNNWTPNNISVTAGTTYDSMVDSPTNYGIDTGVGGEVRGNYCTFNPLAKGPNFPAPTNGNLQTGDTSVGNYHQSIGSTAAVSSGKWYWEIALNGTTYNSRSIGIAFASELATVGDNAMWSSASALKNYRAIELLTSTTVRPCESIAGTITTASTITLPSTLTGSSVFMVAMDIGAGAIWFGLDGTWLKSATTAEIIAGTTTNAVYADISAPTQPWTPAVYNYLNASSGYGWIGKFGQTAFSYTAPSGFKALCTQNLPTATVSNGANYMAATLWTGDGTNGRAISNAVNGVSFQPDWVWIKNRTTAGYSHILNDSVRGAGKYLITNTNGVENTDTTQFASFGASGFTVGTFNNASAQTQVGWSWKAGGTAVTNTAGSITSSVSANTSAGFSVVGYTGTGSNATVGHGLGVAPSMVIIKARGAADWYVGHTSVGWSNTGYLILNNTGAAGQYGALSVWQTTAPSSSVITLGTAGGVNSVTPYIAYCWTAISGYSAFGSYTGNGSSTDGPFVYCGFRPRWLMIKSTNSVDSWIIEDTSRDTYNVDTKYLQANLSDAEGSTPLRDLLSNGFKMRSTAQNISSNTYIYAAFAENPFTLARAR